MCESALDGIEASMLLDWLFEHCYGSRLCGARLRRRFGTHSSQDNGDVSLARRKGIHKLQPAQAREMNVEHLAVAPKGPSWRTPCAA